MPNPNPLSSLPAYRHVRESGKRAIKNQPVAKVTLRNVNARLLPSVSIRGPAMRLAKRADRKGSPTKGRGQTDYSGMCYNTT